MVSVPIASRYHSEFRASHLSPARDVTRITLYTIGRVVHYGDIIASYRRSRQKALVLGDDQPGDVLTTLSS